MKTVKKDPLWNLSQLLGQKALNFSQKVIEKKRFPCNLPRTSITPDCETKFQSLNKNTQKSQLKVDFHFQKLKNTFKQSRSEILFKRSLTLNQQHSTQKFKNSLKNQFSGLKHKRSNSVHCLHQQKPYNNLQFSSNNILPNKNLDPISSRIYIENKSPKQEFISSRLIFQKQSGCFSTLNSGEKKGQPKQKHGFLKKGTSLQKQIVVNLLKNKIIKQHEFQIRKQYTAKDVLSMIKVYKGFHKTSQRNIEKNTSVNNSSLLNDKIHKDDDCPVNFPCKFKKSIEGWDVQPEIQIQ